MPARVLEIVLITIVLFFVYIFSIRFFQDIVLIGRLENDILKYSSNNFLLCLTIINFSNGYMKCDISFEYKNIRIISDGDFFIVDSGGNTFYPNLTLSLIFNKKIFGVAGQSFYLQNNIENITIV